MLNGVVTGENPNRPLRLFVAIAVPDAVRDAITAAQRELQPLAPRGTVRWTRPEQFHLTLQFLGDVPASRIAELKAAVQPVCAGQPALPLSAAGVRFFPNARLPRVIWTGVNDPAGGLVGLQKQLAAALHPFAAKAGAEHYIGHLTLGRCKNARGRGTEELVKHALAMTDRRFGEWTAGEIEIVRSKLTPEGARHILLASFLLAHK